MGGESVGNRNSSKSFYSKYMGDDEEDHNIDLDAKLFEDNMVKKDEEIGHTDNVNLFGQDKEIGIENFDDDLHIPVGSDDKV